MSSEAVLKVNEIDLGEASTKGSTSNNSLANLKEQNENVEDPFSRLDIRVGKITFIQDHPIAFKTYVNHVRYDDNNSKAAILGMHSLARVFDSKHSAALRGVVPKLNLSPIDSLPSIQDYKMSNCTTLDTDNRPLIDHVQLKISKLKGPYRKKSLKKKLVVFVMNVRYKVKHLESESFILYARDKEKNIRELLEPPVDSEPGDRIIAPGVPFIPTIKMPYIKPMREGKRLLDEVTGNMFVDSEGYATYKGIRLTNVMNGMVTAPTVRDCPIKR